MKANNNLLFKPIKAKRAFEEISHQIKSLIIDEVLKPGDKLPSERELSIQFNSGRMVVREALRILENSGFIYIKQGTDGGAFVKGLDTEVATRSMKDLLIIKNVTLNHLTEARLCIEKEIVDKVIECITNDDLDLLENNIKIAIKKIKRKKRVTKENLEFHFLLAKFTKNPIFEMMIQSVLDVTNFYIYKLHTDIKYMEKVVKYHQEILNAIKTKDKKKAKQKIVEHIMNVNSHLSKLMLTN